MNLDNVNVPKYHEGMIISEKEGAFECQKKLKSVLISELDLQSKLASEAYKELETALEEGDELKIWYSAQMFLFTSEKISDLLDKIKELSEKNCDDLETRDLKALSKMYSDLMMIKPNDLSENFGEKLKEWTLDPNNDRIIENHIFKKKSIPNLSVAHLLRHFDPETYELSLRNKTYDIKRQYGLIQNIKKSIEDIYRENFWNL